MVIIQLVNRFPGILTYGVVKESIGTISVVFVPRKFKYPALVYNLIYAQVVKQNKIIYVRRCPRTRIKINCLPNICTMWVVHQSLGIVKIITVFFTYYRDFQPQGLVFSMLLCQLLIEETDFLQNFPRRGIKANCPRNILALL